MPISTTLPPGEFKAPWLRHSWPIIFFDLDAGEADLARRDADDAQDLALLWAYNGWTFGEIEGFPYLFDDALRILERYAMEPVGTLNDQKTVAALFLDSMYRQHEGHGLIPDN